MSKARKAQAERSGVDEFPGSAPPSKAEVRITPAKGRPMLTWVGKRRSHSSPPSPLSMWRPSRRPNHRHARRRGPSHAADEGTLVLLSQLASQKISCFPLPNWSRFSLLCYMPMESLLSTVIKATD